MRLNIHTAREVIDCWEYEYARVTIIDITVEVTESLWGYRTPERQPAGKNSKINTFDCYGPNQVSNPTLEINAQHSYTKPYVSELHGGIKIPKRTCPPIATYQRYRSHPG